MFISLFLLFCFQERDWKLEKLQLNFQTFKSVGNLKVSVNVVIVNMSKIVEEENRSFVLYIYYRYIFLFLNYKMAINNWKRKQNPALIEIAFV